MNIKIPDRRYPPVGHCIYCGATQYKKEGGVLHEEHIIPLGLAGNLLLPHASCQACERITSKFEAAVLRGGLQSFRRYLGLKSRTKPPKKLPLFDINGVNGSKQMIPIGDYPVMAILPMLDAPELIRDELVSRQDEGFWHLNRNVDLRMLHLKYGINAFSTSSMDNESWLRVIAKIAHGYAIAECGAASFRPFLIDYILKGATVIEMKEFIGGIPSLTGETEELHTLAVGYQTVSDRVLVIAKVRPFAAYGGPTYLVVVGEKTPDGKV